MKKIKDLKRFFGKNTKILVSEAKRGMSFTKEDSEWGTLWTARYRKEGEVYVVSLVETDMCSFSDFVQDAIYEFLKPPARKFKQRTLTYR